MGILRIFDSLLVICRYSWVTIGISVLFIWIWKWIFSKAKAETITNIYLIVILSNVVRVVSSPGLFIYFTDQNKSHKCVKQVLIASEWTIIIIVKIVRIIIYWSYCSFISNNCCSTWHRTTEKKGKPDFTNDEFRLWKNSEFKWRIQYFW